MNGGQANPSVEGLPVAAKAAHARAMARDSACSSREKEVYPMYAGITAVALAKTYGTSEAWVAFRNRLGHLSVACWNTYRNTLGLTASTEPDPSAVWDLARASAMRLA